MKIAKGLMDFPQALFSCYRKGCRDLWRLKINLVFSSNLNIGMLLLLNGIFMSRLRTFFPPEDSIKSALSFYDTLKSTYFLNKFWFRGFAAIAYSCFVVLVETVQL
ncbi:hypothetical protein PVK06_026129 [Gossypium arboreum]|uniref:Uncharacterized protein n=1 Tax=Gossypium arboreum TaxID=29729 RepID=A0ABR0NWU5_GOSAR|nr:hypothetical protein PVK06_026129 [Gossypium arboreum]